MKYDRIIIGAGLYGLYSALFCCKKGMNVLVLERDSKPFMRATKINQARVHQGYHYPRSISTAMKSAHYFERFNRDFDFCINSEFEQIYATSNRFSWTNAEQFQLFCKSSGIPCEPLHPDRYFNAEMCDGAFLTREYTYDADILKEYFINELENYPLSVNIRYNTKIDKIVQSHDDYTIYYNGEENAISPFILNSTYASVNQIIDKVEGEKFKIKYELCELILCKPNEKLQNIGITVMDGPFFSIMPYGKTGLHSLTAVEFTPHSTCYDSLPSFSCQKYSDKCDLNNLDNCNYCAFKPKTAYPYMKNLALKYLNSEYEFRYESSIFSMKPILMKSEIDDSRPTVIRYHSESPVFVSVLSGKINTVYDLDGVLIDGK